MTDGRGSLPLDRHLVAPGPSGLLVAMHRALAAVIGFRLVQFRWGDMIERPASLFEPVWAIGWLSSPPSGAVIVLVQIVGVAAAVATVVRRGSRWTFPVAWACLTFLAACWGSSGKVMHNDVLLVTVALPMVCTAVPRRGEPPTVDVRWGWAPRACATVLGAVYFATGFQKLRHSGLEWVFSDNMAWVVRQGRSPFGADLNITFARHGWLMVALAAGALAFELSAPALLWFRRTRVLVPIISFTMHASIWLFLGLDYSPWVLTAAAVGVPFAMRWGAGWEGERWYRRIVWPWQRPEDDPGRASADVGLEQFDPIAERVVDEPSV